MNGLIETLGRLFGHVAFWAIVMPWEQALRVRAGRHVRRLAPGVHWRIPILDEVYKQSVRMRSAMINTQTLQTGKGNLVVSATIGYSIADVERLYNTLHHAEDTIVQLAATAIARFVIAAPASLSADDISEAVSQTLALEFERFGLAEVTVRITDFAFVRTYRLLNDGRWSHQSPLVTDPRHEQRS